MGYQKVVTDAEHIKELSKPDRFVKISAREDRCDLSSTTWKTLLSNTYLQTWKGIILNKGVTEIGIYPMLLWELKPKTIIEIGALNGGSAVCLADNLELFGIQGSVYSIDIDLSLLDQKARDYRKVNFIEGDCHNLSAVLPKTMLNQLPHPWLVIEDAHVNVLGVVEYFHNNGLTSGDYLIVEDTNKSIWDYGSENWEDQEEYEKGRQKMSNLRSWLLDHEDEYLIDTYYQDMYGYNGSKNWNSILIKV
ncbi:MULTISPECIES: CmcI family methyltransferase [unclassified Moorena]|uniref:CmcI family methyltransferase n=1 Tax=unclassified Moorena TaxID=2683338 RepID=UPI001400D6E5|nr:MULTISPECIES: CmcI family methyltransferase [unclassified Moorena]NEO16201.1 cephalosporin hydroxylase [Moorena sp. SIO3E8]NEQ02730.1 cephalosporin hydroxylase [Moorena sp. SIO3F7]